MKLIKDSICCQVKKQNNTNENDSDNISDVNIDTSKVENKNLELNINQLILFFYKCDNSEDFDYDGKKNNYMRYKIRRLGNPACYSLVNNGVKIGVNCLEIHGVLCDGLYDIDIANFWIRLRDNYTWEGKLVVYKYNAQNSSAMDIFEKAIENVTSVKLNNTSEYQDDFMGFLSSKPMSGKNFYNLIKQNGLTNIVYCKIGDDLKKLRKEYCTTNSVSNVCLNKFLQDKTSSRIGIIVSEYNGIMGDGLFDVEEREMFTKYFKEYNDCIVISFLKFNKNYICKFNPKTERITRINKN